MRRPQPKNAAGICRVEREQNANKGLADNGMNVLEPDAAMKAAFLRIGEVMLAEWQKTAGAEGEALIKAYRSK